MKSQFARIKNRASSVSTRALAVMLCFVMLLTAVGAGTMMTAIAAGGVTTPVADAAQKVIDIADSVDVTAAEAAEDEAPAGSAETVFDKLKKQLSELASANADDEAHAPKRKKADLAKTSWDYPSDYNSAYFYGSIAGSISSGYYNYDDSWHSHMLNEGTEDSGKRFYRNFYIETNNSSVTNDVKDYQFRIQTWWDNTYKSDLGGTYWFTTSNTGSNNIMYYTQYDNFHIEAQATSSGILKVKVACNPNASELYVTQTAINAVSASYASPTATAYVGNEVNVLPSVTGGTNSYTYEYAVKDSSNNTVSASKYSITNNKFTANEAGTYVITATATDNTLSTLSDTATLTITVTDPDYYLVGNMNSWNYNNDYKLTNNGDGTYSITTTLTNASSEFKIRQGDSNGNGNGRGTWYGLSGNSAFYINANQYNNYQPFNMESPGQNIHWGDDNTTGDFTITLTAGASPTISFAVPAPPVSYYVTNDQTLTNGDWDMDDPDGKMTLTSGTVYTKVFTGVAEGTYQFRIADGTECKTGGTTPAPTGNVMPTRTGDDNNNITFSLGETDTSWKVTITYDESDNSVTVNAQEVAEEEGGDTSGWLYSGVAAALRTTVDPTDGFSDNTSYYYVYGNNENMTSNVAPSKYSGSEYWIDLDGKYTAGTDFYIGISAYNSKNSLFGSSDTNFNENITTSSDTVIADASGNPLFKVQRRTNNDRYWLLIRDIDAAKVSDIGIVADISTCTVNNQKASAVNYKIYYKAVGGGASSTKSYTVYAKDGTITSTNDVNGLGAFATTSVTNAASVLTGYATGQHDSDARNEYYCTGTLSLNKTTGETKTLEIQTAITTTGSVDDKLYVKGWCVNGETYGYNESDTVASDGIYTFSLPVTYEKFKTDTVIEITPIFYLVGAKTVSFRVENFDQRVQSADWGNTLYAYPFYGALSNVKNSFGAYPGQPLLYYQGKYSIQIPIESLSISYPGDNGTIVRGITLNNGYYDSVHKTASGWSDDASKHKQTYDFDDFYKIYNEKQGNDIIFRFKYRDGSLSYNRDNYFSTTKKTLDSTDIDTKAGDKSWELLTDRLGRVIDVFGNPILKSGSTTQYATKSSEVADYDANVLRVISMGYFDNNAGEYATEWVIFKKVSGTYTRIQSGTDDDYKFSIVPSALLLNNESRFATSVYKTYRDKPVGRYQDLYTVLKTEAAGKPVLISYERDQLRTNNAMRCDGRWYYTTKYDYVQSKIKIQYKTPAGKYIDDDYADSDDVTDVTGQNTGAQAYFTNAKYDGKRESLSEIYSAEPKDYYTFEAVDGDLYQFAGWYLEVDGNTDHPTYTPINPDKDGGYSMSRTSSDVLVARFDPIKAGNVKVSHTVTAGSGTAEFKVETDVSGSYQTIRDYSTATYTIPSTYIKETNNSKHVRITLKTTAGTDNTFNAIDASDATKAETEYFPDTTVTTSSGVTTKTITISIGTLLNNNTSSLTYYSKLTSPTYKYVITYSFNSSRLKTSGGANATISYTSKGDFTAKQYQNNVTITGSGTISGTDRKLKDSFISSNAPHESNFKEILAMNLASVVHSCTQDTSGGKNVITQTATVSFTSSPDTELTGTIDLPYQFGAAIGASGKGAYAAAEQFVNYSSLDEYKTDAEISSLPINEGILEDHSTEPFNLNTFYGGYFVSGDNKLIDMKADASTPYIISAPESILGSDSKIVVKYTMDSNGNGTWDYYGAVDSDAYNAEMQRILSIEGLADTPENRAIVKTKYTKDGKKVYRISNETHYVPNGKTKYFQYWSIKNINNEEVTRCYNNDLNYLAFENYYITPVYDITQPGERSTVSTSISWMGESRNQWNNNGASTVATKAQDATYGLMKDGDGAAADYIWEDFAVDFECNGVILKSSDAAADGITKMGVVVQVAGDRVEGKTSSYDYKELYESGETTANTNNIKNFLKNKYVSTTTYTGKFSVLEIARTNLNNKNRGDYFLRIANSRGWNDTTNQPTNLDINYSGHAIRVYSFIIKNGEVILSEKPAYFCTYGIAKK